MHEIIKDLNWRYATKKFDPSKTIDHQSITVIKESLRLVPSSFGLQPLKYFIIENPIIRQKLRNASYDQSQITDASHLIVICSYLDIRDEDIENYMETIVDIQDTTEDKINQFRAYIQGALKPLSAKDKKVWISKQAYIALGHILQTCAQLRIDATPMEGFNPEAYDEILHLKSKNLQATLVCPIGYRHPEDHTQHRKKVRKKLSDLFEIV